MVEGYRRYTFRYPVHSYLSSWCCYPQRLEFVITHDYVQNMEVIIKVCVEQTLGGLERNKRWEA